ncbi:protein hunchback [Drosophila nasuta]|uniref:protein hunchback n=1 Tax=Drosophila nasuta TaxID=42062 RepID=UPI00295EADAC|nr:protein hunchback [Drosophila nasuta]
MQRTATTTTIEEISSTETINVATISETIGITTIETTPTPAERQPHHHLRHHGHLQREENETTLVITDVSDDATLIIETDTEQPQDRHQHRHHHHHHHRHKHHAKEKQTVSQPLDPLEPPPPPLPTSSPPYLTPTEELTEVVWQTDLDLPPQASEAILPAPLPTISSQPVDEATLPTPPVYQWQPTMPATAATTATAAATVPTTTTAKTTAPQPIVVCQTELIIEEPTQIASPPLPPPPPATTAAAVAATELVLVGTVSVEATDKPKERKSYRVSTDLAAPPQEPRKRCCCIIA